MTKRWYTLSQMDDSRIRTAAELISALISPQAAEAAGTWAKVLGAWPRLVGERAAAHSRIADIANHFVLVDADHPGWIQILQFRQSEILRDIQKRFPELDVRGLQFRLGRRDGGADGPRPPPEAPPATAEETAPEPEAPLRLDPESIQDEALREALRGLKDALEGGREPESDPESSG